MTRIRGGGGPTAPPPTPNAGGAAKTDFAAKISQAQQAAATQAPEAVRVSAARASELTHQAREIGKRFSEGKITQKEATREFVSLVIEERFPKFKKKKKKRDDEEDEQEKAEEDEEDVEERLEIAVTELIDRDPMLAKRLSSQFRKLAKG